MASALVWLSVAVELPISFEVLKSLLIRYEIDSGHDRALHSSKLSESKTSCISSLCDPCDNAKEPRDGTDSVLTEGPGTRC